jgi:hypothetical protein
MLHRLCGPPSIPLSFNLAVVLPRWLTYRFRLVTQLRRAETTSKHRLGRGLPGYLILFDPHAFVPQRQFRSSQLPSQLVFYDISMHFTATCHIPPTSTSFKSAVSMAIPTLSAGLSPLTYMTAYAPFKPSDSG